jgi:hypothetical protein
MLGYEREDPIHKWREVREKFYYLYSSPNNVSNCIERDVFVGTCSKDGETENEIRGKELEVGGSIILNRHLKISFCKCERELIGSGYKVQW